MQDTQLIDQIQSKLKQVTSLLKRRQKLVCAAESCTGGQLSMWLTELAGSADWFERGFITYSNDAKISLLNVPADLIADYGAVSEQVALAMARAALDHSQAHIAIAVTGIAGPGGGTADKPVGTVCFAVLSRNDEVSVTKWFDGQDRHIIRTQSCLYALTILEQFISWQYGSSLGPVDN